MDVPKFIELIEQQNKEQDAIYHNAAVKFGLSDTALWVLYLVSDSEKTYTQQDLCRMCFYPKQTINTAILSLIKGGILNLKTIPGTKNKKEIILTEKGRHLAENSTAHLREAELRAYSALSEKELIMYLELTTKITVSLRKETEKIYKSE